MSQDNTKKVKQCQNCGGIQFYYTPTPHVYTGVVMGNGDFLNRMESTAPSPDAICQNCGEPMEITGVMLNAEGHEQQEEIILRNA